MQRGAEAENEASETTKRHDAKTERQARQHLLVRLRVVIKNDRFEAALRQRRLGLIRQERILDNCLYFLIAMITTAAIILFYVNGDDANVAGDDVGKPVHWTDCLKSAVCGRLL